MPVVRIDRQHRRLWGCGPDLQLLTVFLFGGFMVQLNAYLLLGALAPPSPATTDWFVETFALSTGLLLSEMAARLLARHACTASDYFAVPRNVYDCLLAFLSVLVLGVFLCSYLRLGRAASTALLPLRVWRDVLRLRGAILLLVGEDESSSLLTALQVPSVFQTEGPAEDYLFPHSLSSTSSILNTSLVDSGPPLSPRDRPVSP